MITAIISILIFFGLAAKPIEKQTYSEPLKVYFVDTVKNTAGLESNKNTKAYLTGRFQKFTPWKEGKGANHMFWDWEIVLAGGGSYPVITKSTAIQLSDYENKNVLIYGNIFHGIIIGDSDPNHQSMTGFRIDAENIIILAQTIPYPGFDTCRTLSDIESHYNMYAYVQGKIIEYVPPRDHSKLGDYKIWNWELVMPDNYSIPLTAKNPALDINSFIGKNVTVKAYILNGIIFGEENTASIRGTRIDAEDIYINEPVDPASKIMLKLEDFNDEGLRERPKGEFSSTSYEFCIPATDEAAAEVMGIDPTAGILKTSKGRSGCSDKEWLVISSTRQTNFKQVILKLASLSYVRKITETFWE